MPKIKIYGDYCDQFTYWPHYEDVREDAIPMFEIDASEQTITRWQRITREYFEMQKEMEALSEAHHKSTLE